MPMVDPRERLIVALDTKEIGEARAMVDLLGGMVRFYKIGLGHLARQGASLAQELKGAGLRLFLDYKLFDISSTVERAVCGIATEIEPDFLTVHGDPQIVAAAVSGRGGAPTRILAVTVLTSLDRNDLDSMLLVPGTVRKIVLERARRSLAAGADGLIASPLELRSLRALPECRDTFLVVPGIRPAGSCMDDQVRIASPAHALTEGADHIVVGRPILNAANPRSVAIQIMNELAGE